MQKRICHLIKMTPPAVTNTGVLFSSGLTVPADGLPGYQIGCIFQHTDGGSATALYVNEGSATSCAFKALASSSAETLGGLSDVNATLTYTTGNVLLANGTKYVESAILSATAGTNTESKALIVDANKALDKVFVNTAPVAYNNPALSVGKYGTPVVDATLVDNIAFESVMSTATNKTSGDTSCMAAYVSASNTAATTNNKIQSLLASTILAGNCYDAYGVQGHITVSQNMATQNANAHISGVSGKALLTANNTQGWVTGVLAIVDGTGTTGGICNVIAAQVEATTTAGQVDSILRLGADQTVPVAIEIAGAAQLTDLIKFDALAGPVVAKDVVPGTVTSNTSLGANACLVIDVGGTPYYIPLFTTQHA
jgi:hypothetical protein